MLKSCNKDTKLKRDLLTNSDKMELLGCIVDIFEDFLESHNVNIDNDEREGDNPAIIYGTHYDEIADKVEKVLINSNLLNPICSSTGKECVGCVKNCTSRIIY